MKLKLTISLLADLTAGLLVFIFLSTAYSKLKHPAGFIGAMQHNPLLLPYADLLGWLIPVIEIVIVILLFIPRTRRAGLLASAILLSVFSCYIGYMLLTSSDLPCTCGGIVEGMSWAQHLLFNIAMTILSLATWFYYPKRFVATSRSSRIPVENSRHQMIN